MDEINKPMQQPKYRRVLIKLSGEQIKGNDGEVVSYDMLDYLAQEIGRVHRHGVEIAVVVGGGNIWRGHRAIERGMDAAQSHYMGMLATIINALAMQDAVERQPSRPDFAVLIYPVVSMSEPWGHAGSRDNLTGGHPSAELAAFLSGEKQVNAGTPPMFLVHSLTDTVVPWRNSAELFLALRRAEVPAELHLLDRGEHGYGMGKGDPVIGRWRAFLERWLDRRGLR